MQQKIRIFLPVVLLAFASSVLFWKFFALELLPADHPDMDTVLRYVDRPAAKSWVDFHRGNLLFEAANRERDTSLTGSIQKLDSAIDRYLDSLNLRETPEARENLEAAQKALKLLKTESSIEKKVKEEEQKDMEKSKSGSGGTESGDTDGASSSGSESGKTKGKAGGNPTGKPEASDPGKAMPSPQKRPGVRGYSNSGTFSDGFSGSTAESGLSPQDEKTLRNSLEFLKELQKQK